jgi:hypothetical protein
VLAPSPLTRDLQKIAQPLGQVRRPHGRVHPVNAAAPLTRAPMPTRQALGPIRPQHILPWRRERDETRLSVPGREIGPKPFRVIARIGRRVRRAIASFAASALPERPEAFGAERRGAGIYTIDMSSHDDPIM